MLTPVLATALGIACAVFFVFIALCMAALAVVNVVVKSATRGLYDPEEGA